MKSQLERLYQEMMASKKPQYTKKVCYGDFYNKGSDSPVFLLSGLITMLLCTFPPFLSHRVRIFLTAYPILMVVIMILSAVLGILLHGWFGMLCHRLFLRKKESILPAVNFDDPSVVLEIIAWQEREFNSLKKETAGRIGSNKSSAENNKKKTESSLQNLEDQLETLRLSDLAPIYEERIACAKILISNFEQEISEANNQLKRVAKEEGEIKEILAELHLYYDDVDASFVLQEARKANIAIIKEREAINILIGKLAEQIAKSSGLLLEIRDGKLQQAFKADACLEIGYSPDLNLEHSGHETDQISISPR